MNDDEDELRDEDTDEAVGVAIGEACDGLRAARERIALAVGLRLLSVAGEDNEELLGLAAELEQARQRLAAYL